MPSSLLGRDVRLPVEPSPEVQAVLLEIYRGDDAALADLCERLVDLDEGIQEWRYRHVKMVERTIGIKTGTGGSAGVEYLKTTLFRPAVSGSVGGEGGDVRAAAAGTPAPAPVLLRLRSTNPQQLRDPRSCPSPRWRSARPAPAHGRTA